MVNNLAEFLQLVKDAQHNDTKLNELQSLPLDKIDNYVAEAQKSFETKLEDIKQEDLQLALEQQQAAQDMQQSAQQQQTAAPTPAPQQNRVRKLLDEADDLRLMMQVRTLLERAKKDPNVKINPGLINSLRASHPELKASFDQYMQAPLKVLTSQNQPGAAVARAITQLSQSNPSSPRVQQFMVQQHNMGGATLAGSIIAIASAALKTLTGQQPQAQADQAAEPEKKSIFEIPRLVPKGYDK